MIASLNITKYLFGLSSAMMSSYQQQSSRYRCMAALLHNSLRCGATRISHFLTHMRHWSFKVSRSTKLVSCFGPLFFKMFRQNIDRNEVVSKVHTIFQYFINFYLHGFLIHIVINLTQIATVHNNLTRRDIMTRPKKPDQHEESASMAPVFLSNPLSLTFNRAHSMGKSPVTGLG
jgi:hypothetical protein